MYSEKRKNAICHYFITYRMNRRSLIDSGVVSLVYSKNLISRTKRSIVVQTIIYDIFNCQKNFRFFFFHSRTIQYHQKFHASVWKNKKISALSPILNNLMHANMLSRQKPISDFDHLVHWILFLILYFFLFL